MTADIGKAIRRHRSRLRLSQGQVATLLGVRTATVSDWEGGKYAPSGANLIALAEVFGVTEAELRAGDFSRFREAVNGAPEPDAELPRRLELLALDFEKEMVEADVDQDFRRYARARLRDPELLEMYAGGHSQGHMSADDQLADYEDLLDELRGRLKRRLALLKQRRGK